MKIPVWISVDERLPKEREDVIVYREPMNDKRIGYLRFASQYNEPYFVVPAYNGEPQDQAWEVTRWHPLPPDPPEAE